MTHFPLAAYAAALSDQRRSALAHAAQRLNYAALVPDPVRSLATLRRGECCTRMQPLAKWAKI